MLFVIAVGIFLFIEEFEKEKSHRRFFDFFRPEKKSERPIPEIAVPPLQALPKIAIVMDDLGPNRQKAEEVFTIKSPLTLSILPKETYSSWIAEQGYRRDYDIIVHVPMEAAGPFKLGKGGLHLWMADHDIAQTLKEDIRSVPYSIGVSNHMGSAFTEDKAAMNIVLSELKKQRLFFLDSRTTPKSAGFDLARARGLRTFRRDVFLDDTDDPAEIKRQWKKLVAIAQKRGHAIALAHPRENTLDFLKKVLKENEEITVVPLSELPGY